MCENSNQRKTERMGQLEGPETPYCTYMLSKHLSQLNITGKHVPCARTVVCMHVSVHACVNVLLPHTIKRHVRIFLHDCERAFTYFGDKVRLKKWEFFTHVWAEVRTCIHLP